MYRYTLPALALAFALTACGGSSPTSAPAAPSDATAAPVAEQPTDAPEATEAPAGDATIGMNTPVTLSDVEYTVTAAESKGDTLPTAEEFYEDMKVESPEARWVVVRVDAKNNGADMNSIESPAIVDSAGREFTPTTFIGGGYLPEGEDCSFESINPGLSKTCSWAFQVPKAADVLKLRLTGAMFSGDSADVELGIGAE